jgi:DNA-directed RNA polymerase subunit N (RpoN/RPB10)
MAMEREGEKRTKKEEIWKSAINRQQSSSVTTSIPAVDGQMPRKSEKFKRRRVNDKTEEKIFEFLCIHCICCYIMYIVRRDTYIKTEAYLT